MNAHKNIQFAVATLAAAGLLWAMQPHRCRADNPVITKVEKAVIPDLSLFVTPKGGGTKKAVPFNPLLQAALGDAAKKMGQARSPGMPTPNGNNKMPGAPVPGGPSNPNQGNGQPPANLDWPGLVKDIVGAALGPQRRPGGYPSGPMPGNTRPGKRPKANQGNSCRPPKNTLPGRQPKAKRRHIILMNPASTEATVFYKLGNNSYALRPGRAHQLDVKRRAIIEFDRGDALGTARYELDGGSYEFSVSSQGWDLNVKTFEVTIDNSNNSHPFYCVVDGQETQVRANWTSTFTSDQPVVVVFDRGDGQNAIRKTLDDGTYAVGVNPGTHWLDLMPVKQRSDTKVASDHAHKNQLDQ